jgi:hypothetical protein
MVVAVNAAIAHPARSTFWFCRDPKAVYGRLPLDKMREPVLVHPARWDSPESTHAFSAWPWEKQQLVDDVSRWPFDDRRIQERCPFLHEYAGWQRFTMTSAVAWLLSIGFREVQIFGADLAGTGTFEGPPCYATEEAAAARWQRERHALELLTGLAGGEALTVLRRTD